MREDHKKLLPAEFEAIATYCLNKRIGDPSRAPSKEEFYIWCCELKFSMQTDEEAGEDRRRAWAELRLPL